MIPDNTRDIKEYLLIDRCGDGFGVCKPEEGQRFVGIPHDWYDMGQQPFIEIREGDKVVSTVNCADVSQIWFSTAEEK